MTRDRRAAGRIETIFPAGRDPKIDVAGGDEELALLLTDERRRPASELIAVVRDIRQLSADIDAAISEFFAARGITPAEET